MHFYGSFGDEIDAGHRFVFAEDGFSLPELQILAVRLDCRLPFRKAALAQKAGFQIAGVGFLHPM
jgi:hypothetical protein